VFYNSLVTRSGEFFVKILLKFGGNWFGNGENESIFAAAFKGKYVTKRGSK